MTSPAGSKHLLYLIPFILASGVSVIKPSLTHRLKKALGTPVIVMSGGFLLSVR